MTLHRQTKTTPAFRAALVQRALAGESYAVMAQGMGMSVRTAANWGQRFRRGGPAALEDGSCRPRQLGTSWRALAWFAARGVTVRRVMSDNGSGYVSRACRAACDRAGLRHPRPRAYTPRTSGKAERFIQTLHREWAYARPSRTSAERRAAVRP